MKKISKTQLDNILEVLKSQRFDKIQIDNLIEIFKKLKMSGAQVQELFYNNINKHTPTRLLSDFIKRTDRRVLQLANEGVIIRGSSKKYILIESINNFIDLLETKNNIIVDNKKRIDKLKADKLEIELREWCGELVETEFEMLVYGERIAAHRAKMLAIPRKLAPLILSCKNIPEAEEKLKKAIYETLTELADPGLIDLAIKKVKAKRAKNKK